MQKISDSTNTANPAGEFTEGNPAAGAPATLLKAQWLNAIQRELCNLVEGSGQTLAPTDDSQVLKAVMALVEAESTWSQIKDKPTTRDGFHLSDVFTKTETEITVKTALAELVASSPEALDTLNELAQALGNDPNFATTMTKALSEKAEKANTFTKEETASAITTALNITITNVSASKTLSADELGLVLIDASSAAVTVELPPSDTALGVRGVVLRRTDNTGNRLVIQAAENNKIKFHTHLRKEGYPFFVLMGAGDYWHLYSDGAGGWIPTARFDSTPLGRPVFETTVEFSPGGWASLNGWLYSRVEWPWAWDHAKASGMLASEAQRPGNEGGWTSGDGVSTFRSPEARAEFLRFLDESRGIDVGRLPGSSKLSQNKEHEHPARTYLGLTGASGSNGLVAYTNTTIGSQLPSGAVGFEGGSENYPRHIAYPGRIKMI
ncbi:hypothetical protein [Pseudomonas salomonii]|uniref:Phage Tail Collar Domain n=1 Tax=Pseudomonas salomonii TaxID=191391 RepID=A0A1H3SLU6_9PSED|nr:hypothetical protein [Pseudomonas salomonii]SDZ38914.1 hypothetical protein SAMN05216247_109290 [Pseudomonas salomonii]